jgi:hypothetical protein
MNIKIYKDSSEFKIPLELFKLNDLNLESKIIFDIDDSLFNMIISNYPFNFIIMKKENVLTEQGSQTNQVLLDTRSNSIFDLFAYSEKFKQFYTKLEKDHYCYGLVIIIFIFREKIYPLSG